MLIGTDLIATVLVASATVSAAPQVQHAHQKRLFGWNWWLGQDNDSDNSVTTSSTTSSTSSKVTTTSSSATLKLTSTLSSTSSIVPVTSTNVKATSTSTTAAATCSAGAQLRSTTAFTQLASTGSNGFASYPVGFDVGNGYQYPDSTNLIYAKYGIASYAACTAACAAYNSNAGSIQCTAVAYVTQYQGCFGYYKAPDCGWSRDYDVYSGVLAGTNGVALFATISSSGSSAIGTSSKAPTSSILSSTSSSSSFPSSSSSMSSKTATSIATSITPTAPLVISTTPVPVINNVATQVTTNVPAVVSSIASVATSVTAQAVSSAKGLSTSIAVSVSVATPTVTSKTTFATSAMASASPVSLVCSKLPSWAYSGWCSTSQTLIDSIVANALTPGSLAKGVIIPLYIYPSWWTTPGAWDWVVNAANNYPTITFTIIVNPNNGPGSGVAPNSDYQHEIAKLNALGNVKLLGYVDTAYGSRSAAAVANDISTYAGWASVSSTLAMDGIFFDNQAPGIDYLSQYSSYASQVRQNSKFTSKTVGFGPGTICNPAYLDLADFVMVFTQASAILQANLFGWYQSFLTSLSTSQLSKLSWVLSSSDSTTTAALANIQAAFNSQYLMITDVAPSAAFVSPPSAAVFTSVLNKIASPLSITS